MIDITQRIIQLTYTRAAAKLTLVQNAIHLVPVVTVVGVIPRRSG